MRSTHPQKPITQQWDYIATSWALAALYNPFAQLAIGAVFWTATIMYVCFAQSAPAVTADCLNVLFTPWNILADLTGLPRAPYLEG
ncbi:MAG: hypothetical protein LKI99_06020 [Acetobacter fabarum]|jgi:hypothetical protein|nr:hypothetical protein [Acetobacter fabarum]MCI1909252.1 hypothetical protein [Acetobacter fabarum]MCI1927230.1 hypothetical protein [Acetobacter fabarum]MCI1947230.1 hypothetical protein [Acetobacter fabarum]MCI1988516.1 hypothetical protein [Acetobacter fabarum]